MFDRIGNEMAVLTTYPKATKESSKNWKPPVPQKGESVVAICTTTVVDRNFMFKHERGKYIKNPGQPALSAWFAAGKIVSFYYFFSFFLFFLLFRPFIFFFVCWL